jgi:MFS family permease
MNRKLAIFAAVIAAFAFTAQAADAHGRKHVSKRLTAVSIGVGAASTAAYFALNDWHWKWDSSRSGITSLGAWGITTVGCAAASPIVATAVLGRPLKYREAHILIGSCVLPFVGGWLVNEAYNHHVLTAPDEKVEHKRHHRHHRHHHRYHHHKM